MNRYFLLLCLMAIVAQAQYAVPSAHSECQSQCAPSDYTCCGCCGTDSSCSGNKISKRCCPTNSYFCGCISDRGFCSGSVFNQTTQVNGTDTFGSCFDPNAATCTYEPSPNLWVVCPKDYQPCTSSSFFSCCAPDSYCVTSTYNSSYPICQSRTAPSAEPTPTKTNTCPSNLSSCGDACYQDDLYCCVNGGLVQKQFCGGNPESQTPTDSPSSGVCGAGLLQCGDACYTDDQYCCKDQTLIQKPFCGEIVPAPTKAADDSVCAGKCGDQSCCPTPSGALCYAPSTHTCDSDDLGNSQVCPLGLSACGLDCYETGRYYCKNGALQHYRR